jgi:hypothetical protein
LLSGKNEMVKDRKVDRLPSSNQSSRRDTVGPAWHRISPRMIVREKDAGTTQPGRIQYDVADRQFDRFRLPFITFDMEAPRGSVDMSDPKALSRVASKVETCAKEPPRGFDAI